MNSVLDLRLLTAAAIGCSIGLWLAYAGLKIGGDQYSSNIAEFEENKGAWVLAVTMKFASEEAKQEFVQIWREEAEHVHSHEQGTLGYELMQSDQDPLQVMIFERYRRRGRDYLEVHKQSQVFLAFREK